MNWPETVFRWLAHLRYRSEPTAVSEGEAVEQLADPSAEDLRDPDRLWEWGDPDTEAVVLAEGLDWSSIAAVLGLDPGALDQFSAGEEGRT